MSIKGLKMLFKVTNILEKSSAIIMLLSIIGVIKNLSIIQPLLILLIMLTIDGIIWTCVPITIQKHDMEKITKLIGILINNSQILTINTARELAESQNITDGDKLYKLTYNLLIIRILYTSVLNAYMKNVLKYNDEELLEYPTTSLTPHEVYTEYTNNNSYTHELENLIIKEMSDDLKKRKG